MKGFLKNCALLLLAASACWSAAASPKHHNIYPPYLTIDMFIAKYHGTPHPNIFNVGSSYAKHHALGYLAGVTDASQGRSWCVPRGFDPDKADALVVSELTKILPDLVKRSPGPVPPYAGPVLLNEYNATFTNISHCVFTPRMTGDEFVARLMGELEQPGVTKGNQSEGATNKQRYAEGYVGGVIDATQGSSWCAPRRMKPGELTERGWSEMLERRGQMPGNAATILLEQYIRKYPCPQS